MKRIEQLTGRDRKLLEVVDSYGMLSSSQIRHLMFSEIDHRTMLRRLRVLESKKFISRIDGLPRGELTWLLTAKAANLIGSELVIKGVNRNTLKHDVFINQVRMSLRHQTKHWVSGHHLKKDSGIKSLKYNKEHVIPDSLFSIKVEGEGFKTIALEVELIAKSKKRYQRIVNLYLDNKHVDYLWYVVPSDGIGKKVLKEVDLKTYQKPYDWVMWSNIDDVRTSRSFMTLNFKKKSIPLHKFTDRNSTRKPFNIEDDLIKEVDKQTKPQEIHKSPAHTNDHIVSTQDEINKLWISNN